MALELEEQHLPRRLRMFMGSGGSYVVRRRSSASGPGSLSLVVLCPWGISPSIVLPSGRAGNYMPEACDFGGITGVAQVFMLVD